MLNNKHTPNGVSDSLMPFDLEPEDLIQSSHGMPSNNGHGTDDTLRIIRILEDHDIPCCLVGISALIFYGAGRSRPDWEICIPTQLIEKAVTLLQSKPYSTSYHLVEPWANPSSTLIHTYYRFKTNKLYHYFLLVPSRDVHLDCNPSNFTRSLRGLPYPKLNIFIQSCLDMGNRLQLCDVIDGTNVPEKWEQENLDLEGTSDVEWAKDMNRRGIEYAGGKFAHWAPFASDIPKSKREMWQSSVRTKQDRLDMNACKEIFVTQYRLVDQPDPWMVLSDRY